MNKEEFKNELSKLGISLTDTQIESLEKYANILIDYNKHTNITAITDKESIYLKHFYDSLTLSKIIDLTKDLSVLDVGSGGGFPGIVIKIVYPNLKLTLLDSNNKKSEFQRYVINKLKLTDINVINDRAENYFKKGNKYDLVVARAVSNMPVLDELCIPFLKIGGNLVLMKADASTELENSKSGIKILGGEITDIQKFNLPKEESLRTLIKITKVNETPPIYPRNYDKITKKPLK